MFSVFYDFQLFLREAMQSPEYQKWIVYPPSEKELLLLLGLTHTLCFSLVTRESGINQEAVGLIHRSIRRGGELQSKELFRQGKGTWNQLLFDDEKLRTLLERFPGGPLLKTLEIIRTEEEGAFVPFDPWIQGNLPSKLYHLRKKGKNIDVLSLGSPTRQGKISRAEIVDEFRGFLRYLHANEKMHLLINLQDRLSWHENARSAMLEHLQENAMFSPCLMVITLPKNTDFYYQRNGFADLDIADDFLSAFIDQIDNPEESGFFFPEKWKKKDRLEFTKSALSKIHETVFGGERSLTRQMREDFIELFYQLLVTEVIEKFDVSTISFTCKDAIDTGAYASGLFFGFLKGYQGDLTTKENLDALRFMFYWRALSIRERASDGEPFFRTLSALQTWNRCMEEGGSKVAKIFPITWVA